MSVKLCPSCQGNRRQDCYVCHGSGWDNDLNDMCKTCFGSGEVYCQTCDGTGTVK